MLASRFSVASSMKFPTIPKLFSTIRHSLIGVPVDHGRYPKPDSLGTYWSEKHFEPVYPPEGAPSLPPPLLPLHQPLHYEYPRKGLAPLMDSLAPDLHIELPPGAAVTPTLIITPPSEGTMGTTRGSHISCSTPVSPDDQPNIWWR